MLFGRDKSASIETHIDTHYGEAQPTRFANLTYTWLEFECANYTQRSNPVDYPSIARSELIKYRFNRDGYRCADFSMRKQINVMTIGCSETFGVGVPEEERFSSIFCRDLAAWTGESVQDFNVGLGARSNDWIARTAIELSPVLRPEIVLCCFTYLGRREYIDDDGFVHAYLPGVPLSELPTRFVDVWSWLSKLDNRYENSVNLHKNHILCRCATKDSVFLYAFVDRPPETVLARLGHGCVGEFERVDVCSDKIHRSTISHSRLAAKFLRKYQEYVETPFS